MSERTLEIDRVSKRFGDITALDSVSFDIRPGELFGFVGSNGAGKTTAMRIVLGVLAADSGEVRYDGEPVGHETRTRMGYMPEERGLYPKMKVLDQLVYLAQLHGLPANEAHRSAEDWIGRLGLSERRGDEVQKLSLGNQQRVQLAAALVHDPDVLVLDEPFSGLDPIAVDVMSQVLREKAATGVPVVFSSHQLDLVERLCDRVGIIRSGQIVGYGSVADLTANAAPRITVVAPGAPWGWAAALPGVRVISEQPESTVVELGPDVDDQAVLTAALATGPVHEFARHRPSLAELFRNAVTEGSVA
ncbi:ABC transporter ATP-binding protein [Prauserella marina]|uniref:ABC-2 type transport system ATP-binding protein n=1 Tax=Prauserella marina TaxID=530584 RepID=A0A222VW58_9PSEU|nr:ATP-binding cassette domain-containing protein [Prauserella marina]ASR38169.1 ABC transporter ATP-binding protein [Prauserella marina]PWV78657.1 ABC-2 type transport system ATP-binding protein [Prauserella marina]SDC90914.1 ABC-2 type transport system ATP-binding protein [Prauserella marina]